LWHEIRELESRREVEDHAVLGPTETFWQDKQTGWNLIVPLISIYSFPLDDSRDSSWPG
jgi:hypothetical protein